VLERHRGQNQPDQIVRGMHHRGGRYAAGPHAIFINHRTEEVHGRKWETEKKVFDMAEYYEWRKSRPKVSAKVTRIV